jgi:magnesium-transporting ATPase (P-type)
MKLFLTFLFSVLMLSANGLLYLFLFRRRLFFAIWSKLFTGKDFLILLIYDVILILPVFAVFTKPHFKPHVFMDHGLSGFVYILPRLVYPILCLSLIPYKILKREYSKKAKIWGLLICIFSLLIGLFALVLGTDLEFRN